MRSDSPHLSITLHSVSQQSPARCAAVPPHFLPAHIVPARRPAFAPRRASMPQTRPWSYPSASCARSISCMPAAAPARLHCSQLREFFIPKSSYWNKDSWISFRREVEVRTVHQVQSAIEDKKCRIVTTLPETVINEIKNCMKRCCLDDLPRDVCEILGLKYGG